MAPTTSAGTASTPSRPPSSPRRSCGGSSDIDRAGLFTRVEGADHGRGQGLRSRALQAVHGHPPAAPDGGAGVPPARARGATGRVRAAARDRAARGDRSARRRRRSIARSSSMWVPEPGRSRSRSPTSTPARASSRRTSRPRRVALARANATRLHLDVTVDQGDLFAAMPAELRGRIDLVCAQPAVRAARAPRRAPARRARRPGRKPSSASPGLYRRLFDDARSWVRPGGTVVVEIDDDAGGREVRTAAEAAGFADVAGPHRPQRPRPRGIGTTAVSGDPVADAVAAARRGELVVFPTDTVYGIAARPDDPAATARVFEAKQRPSDLTLPVLVASVAQARAVAQLDDRAERLAAAPVAGSAHDRRAPRSAQPGLGPGRRPGVDRRPDPGPSARARGARRPVRSPRRARTGRARLPPPPARSSTRSSATPSRCTCVTTDRSSARASTVVSLLGPVPAILRGGNIDPAVIERLSAG